MSFEDLIQLLIFGSKETNRKEGFWMTTDLNFQIIKRIETKNAKKNSKGKRKTKN